MKKTLLLAAAALSTSAFAQTTWLGIDDAALGFSGDAIATQANMLLAEDENGALYIAFENAGVKTSGIQACGYATMNVGGLDWAVTGGITGDGNPKPESLTGAPDNGFCLKYVPKKDGYLTIPSKFNTNKSYWAFEGTSSMMAYTMGLADATGKLIEYSIPADEFGYVDFKAANIGTFFFTDEATGDPTKIKKPVEAFETLPSTNVFGIMQFPVVGPQEGTPIEYYFGAYGSKISCAGVFMTPGATAAPSVTMATAPAEGDPVTVTFGDPSGVNQITIGEPVLDENAPIYNVQGMRVNKDAKGILIQNGKKFVRF